MARVVPMDARIAARQGVDALLSGFGWPVSVDEHKTIIALANRALDEVCLSAPQRTRDVVMCARGGIMHLAVRLQCLLVEQRVEAAGDEVAFGPESVSYAQTRWPDRAVLERHLGRPSPGLKARKAAKNWVGNRHMNPLRRLGSRGAVPSLGSLDPLRREYTAHFRIKVDNHYPQTFFPAPAGGSLGEIEDAARSVVGTFVESFEGAFGVRPDVVGMLKGWLDRLNLLAGLYDALAQSPMAPRTFLFTEPGNPLHCLASCVLRRKGTMTATFEHGNTMGGLVEHSMAYVGPVFCDEYVCSTASGAEAFARTYSETGAAKLNDPAFTSVQTNAYRDLHQSSRSRDFGKSGNGVSAMLLGFPMNTQRYSDNPELYFPIQLDLELRMVRQLLSAGIRVLYKAHPVAVDRVGGLFEGMGAEVVREPFEEAWNMADVVISKYTSSTVFGHALCLPVPLVVFGHEAPDWRADHWELLGRRCLTVPSSVRQDGRVEYDEAALLAHVRKPGREVDHAYCQRFMFPQGPSTAGAALGGGSGARTAATPMGEASRNASGNQGEDS